MTRRLEELPAKWREKAASMREDEETTVAVTIEDCANELESALSAPGQVCEKCLLPVLNPTHQDVPTDPYSHPAVVAGAPGQGQETHDLCACGHMRSYHRMLGASGNTASVQCDAAGCHCSAFRLAGQGQETAVWRPIATAPKDGTRIDIWAKSWLPAFDKFAGERFPNCCWMQGDSMTNRKPYWLELRDGWFPTHWMPLPPAPEREP